MPNRDKVLAELRAARTAWHEDFGVPISSEYARFLEAIGAIENLVVAPSPATKDTPRPTPYTLRQSDGSWIAHALEFDLIGADPIKEDAIAQLKLCLGAQIAFGCKQGLGARQCYFPAPVQYWKPPYAFMSMPTDEELAAFKFETTEVTHGRDIRPDKESVITGAAHPNKHAANSAEVNSISQGPAREETPQPKSEAEHYEKVAASIPIIAHPKMVPDSAFALFDDLTILLYSEDGQWRVQTELADGTKAIISVNNRMQGELARVQIRGIALQLLGHFLKSQDAGAQSRTTPVEFPFHDFCNIPGHPVAGEAHLESRTVAPQPTICAVCGLDKATPLRIDWLGGYVCLRCVEEWMNSQYEKEQAGTAAPQPAKSERKI